MLYYCFVMDTFQQTDSQDISAGAVTSHAARLLSQALAEAQQTLRIAPAQYRIMRELWREDGLVQKNLIARLDIEQSTIGNTINRMVRDGLIERQPHPQDGRSQILCLTPHAKKMKDQAVNIACRINDKALSGFSEEEKIQFFSLMDKMIKALRGGA